MSIEQIGKANAGDQPQLHRLWESVFGDPPELVQAFFDRFPPEAFGWVVRQGDRICSAAYLLPGNWYVCQTEMQPAAYVYAVATDLAERKKGYAGRLMQAIAEFAQERGLLLYTRPAEPSLFPWYANKMGAKQTCCFQEQLFHAQATSNVLPCRRISSQEYGTGREKFLSSTPHLLLSENFLRLQEVYSDGYYAIGDGCCCIIQEKGKLHIPELLLPETQTELAVQSLMAHFDAQEVSVRSVGNASDDPGVAYTGTALPIQTNWGFFLE